MKQWEPSTRQRSALVGYFILHGLESNLGVKSFRLYRDDGLAVLRCTGRIAGIARMRIIRLGQKVLWKLTSNLMGETHCDIPQN